MRGSEFDELVYFKAIQDSGARALLIGRRVLVDVLVARAVTTVDGVTVAFSDVWKRRRSIQLAPDVAVQTPVSEGSQ